MMRFENWIRAPGRRNLKLFFEPNRANKISIEFQHINFLTKFPEDASFAIINDHPFYVPRFIHQFQISKVNNLAE